MSDDEPLIDPVVLSQMIDENTSTWQGLAQSIREIPAELRNSLLTLFEPADPQVGSRVKRTLAMIYKAIDRFVADQVDDSTMELLATYRQRAYGNAQDVHPTILMVELLAPAAIAMTFYLDEL